MLINHNQIEENNRNERLYIYIYMRWVQVTPGVIS